MCVTLMNKSCHTVPITIGIVSASHQLGFSPESFRDALEVTDPCVFQTANRKLKTTNCQPGLLTSYDFSIQSSRAKALENHSK